MADALNSILDELVYNNKISELELEQIYAAVEAQIKECKNNMTVNPDRVMTMLEENEALKHHNKVLKTDLKNTNDACAQLHERVNKREKTIKELKKTIRRLKNTRRRLKEKLKKPTRQQQRNNRRTTTLLNDNRELEASNARLQQHCERIAERLDEVVDDYEDQLAKTIKERDAFANHAMKLRQEKKSWRDATALQVEQQKRKVERLERERERIKNNLISLPIYKLIFTIISGRVSTELSVYERVYTIDSTEEELEKQ